MNIHRNAKKGVIITAVITLVFLSEAVSEVALAENNRILNNTLLQYGVGLRQGDSFLVVKDRKFPFREKILHKIVAQKKQTLIKLEIISPFGREKANDYSEYKYKIIKNLYEPRIIPYLGMLTTTTDCPEDKKPQEMIIEVMEKPAKVLLVNATERFVLGPWDDDLIKQKAAFAVLYAEKNDIMFQMIIFQPYETFNPDEVLDILKGFKEVGTCY